MSAQVISPERQVADAERRGEHRVVGVGDLELEVDVERRVEDRTVHRRRGEEPGCDIRRVLHDLRADVQRADELVEADADRKQVEERLEEAGHEEHPLAPVDEDVALDEAPRARLGDEAERGEPEDDGRRSRDQPPPERDARDQVAADHEDEQVTGVHRHQGPVDLPEHELAAQASRRGRAVSRRRAGRSHAGSWVIGKKVPENRKSGTTPKR